MNRIIISEGDPCGINYKIIFKILPKLIEISKKNQIIYVLSQNQISLPSNFNQISDIELPSNNGLYFIYNSAASFLEEKLERGKPCRYSGFVSFESLKASLKIQKKYPDSALLTMPLSKEWVIKAGYENFVGHTEYLAEFYKKPTFMLMYGKFLRVILLSNHIALSSISEKLKLINVSDLILAIKNYCNFFKISNLKIGFLGLNPHCGEDGLIGTEEKLVLKDILNVLKKKFDIYGFLSADTAFTEDCREKFNFFIANYHDQGLIPFKILEGKNGINVTLGLDFLRVSPDHGPAFKLLDDDKIDSNSVLSCLELLAK